ncbi:DUF1365 family protein [bacterium]|nr:DUF1365 family protein [bacterium]
MIQPAPIQLYVGRTVHVRETPFRRSFSHRIAMIDIDIDQLDAAARSTPLFGVDRARPISFRQRDHGERRPGARLRAWAEARLREAGVEAEELVLRLIAFPRVLGYGFSPISLWCAATPDGEPRAVIYEVHNTFGESHSYVSPLDGSGVRNTAQKALHVSPFFDVSGRYRFTFRPPDDKLHLIVENVAPDGREHIASLVARRRPLTTGSALSLLARMPLSGLGVMAAIHWQALLLLLRGARYRDKPDPSEHKTTLAEGRVAPVPDERPHESQ